MKTFKQCIKLAQELAHLFGDTHYEALDVDDVMAQENSEALAEVFKLLRDRILEDGECELFNIYKVWGWLDLGLVYTGHAGPLLITVFNVKYMCEQFGPAPEKFWFAWDGNYITYENLQSRVMNYNSDIIRFDYKVEQA